MKRPIGVLRAILFGTIVVGTLDILDAILFYGWSRGVKPTSIFQSIASGLLGRASYNGGLKTAVLGGFLHYFIAFGIVTAYYLVSLRVDALTRNTFVFGVLYGLAVFGIMNFVVLPLSRAGAPQFGTATLINGLVGHALLIGYPSALFARWGQKGVG